MEDWDEDVMEQESKDHVQAQLAAGWAISYADEDYPGEIVREFPDGRRQIVDCHDDGEEFVVREIEPRKENRWLGEKKPCT